MCVLKNILAKIYLKHKHWILGLMILLYYAAFRLSKITRAGPRKRAGGLSPFSLNSSSYRLLKQREKCPLIRNPNSLLTANSPSFWKVEKGLWLPKQGELSEIRTIPPLPKGISFGRGDLFLPGKSLYLLNALSAPFVGQSPLLSPKKLGKAFRDRHTSFITRL